jgi:hypothetical protein
VKEGRREVIVDSREAARDKKSKSQKGRRERLL